MSHGKLGAKPHSAENSPNNAKPAIYISLRPTISARRALYRPRIVRHRLACYAASTAVESWFCRTAAGVWNRGLEPVPFDEPGCVVALPKDQQRLTELLDGVERLHPEQVLLERADEALGAAVPLGSPHEGRRALDAEKGKFPLEGVGHVLAPMIVAHQEPTRDPRGKAAHAAAHALPDGLKRLKAGGPTCGMDADALG